MLSLYYCLSETLSIFLLWSDSNSAVPLKAGALSSRSYSRPAALASSAYFRLHIASCASPASDKMCFYEVVADRYTACQVRSPFPDSYWKFKTFLLLSILKSYTIQATYLIAETRRARPQLRIDTELQSVDVLRIAPITPVYATCIAHIARPVWRTCPQLLPARAADDAGFMLLPELRHLPFRCDSLLCFRSDTARHSIYLTVCNPPLILTSTLSTL
ncbi:hypothetical protein R3P38DRAFT_1344500 [Favolaschia claudopus]|uniref:Secreted protein n=1 Tax=Favolaschia claudopus TaxID=2862362 RepID=A0AAW0DUI2_9AGAR